MAAAIVVVAAAAAITVAAAVAVASVVGAVEGHPQSTVVELPPLPRAHSHRSLQNFPWMGLQSFSAKKCTAKG